MKQRLKFTCWHCSREYELTREVLSVRVLQVACPFCGQEAIVDLIPYLSNTHTVYRSDKPVEQASDESSLILPPVLPTKPKPVEE